MHQLKVPLALSGSQIDRHQTLGEQVVPGTLAPVVVVRGHLHGQIRHSQLFIDRNLRPHAGVAAVGPGILLPRVVAELAGSRDRVEDPEALAGSHVVPADIPLHVTLAPRVRTRLVRGAHDHHISGDDGRRVEADASGRHVDLLIEVELQVDDASAAEAGHRGAGLRVERDEAVPRRHVQDPLLLAIGPVREATA